MKSIVILNQSISNITLDIANSLQKHGYRVTLFTGSSVNACQDLQAEVKLTQLTPYRRASAVQRLFTWSAFTANSLLRIVWKKRPYEVFAVTNPPFNVFSALLLYKTLGIQYHLLLFDIYPDAAVQYGFFRAGGMIDRLWGWLTKASFTHATTIFSISDRMSDTIRKYTAADRQIHIIHNWADNTAIEPIDKHDNRFLTQLGLSSKKTVLYSGNFGKTHDLTSIIEAARILSRRHDIHFLMIGDGEQKNQIAGLVKKYQLSNFSLLPYVDSETFPFSVASGDITIVTLDAQAESISTPSKTYCAMAAGSAIVAVASARSELADLVAKHNMGLVVPPGNAETLAKQLEALLDNDQQLNEFKANARIASHDYTPANADLYSRIIMETNPSTRQTTAQG